MLETLADFLHCSADEPLLFHLSYWRALSAPPSVMLAVAPVPCSIVGVLGVERTENLACQFPSGFIRCGSACQGGVQHFVTVSLCNEGCHNNVEVVVSNLKLCTVLYYDFVRVVAILVSTC